MEDKKADLGSDSDVGEWDSTTRSVPLGDVEQPLGGGSRLKEVAKQSSNLVATCDSVKV